MIVMPFGYPLDDRFIKKVDIMINRCIRKNPKRDSVFLFEGPEGEGKTTYAVATAYYIRNKTGRKFNHFNVFFDLQKMIEFLQSTEDQIAIWDEPSLQALSKDAMTTIVKDLERLLMTSRKKRHFVIINLAYFNKFSEYIVWQRPLGMIHVYSRNELEAGRYVYIKRKNLEYLWQDWRTKHKRNYKKFYTFRGTFPDVLNPEYKNNVLSDFDLAYYDSEKDKAINSIGKKKEIEKNEYRELKRRIGKLELPIKTQKELALKLGLSSRTIRIWSKIEDKNNKIEHDEEEGWNEEHSTKVGDI